MLGKPEISTGTIWCILRRPNSAGKFGVPHDANRSYHIYYGYENNDSTEVSQPEILFSFMLEKYIGLRYLLLQSNNVLYINLLIPLPCRNWWRNATQLPKPCFDGRRTLGMLNLMISHSFKSIWLFLLIGLDIWTIMYSKTGVSYHWVWPLYLVSINSAGRLP